MVYLEDAQIADVRVGEELNIINLEHSACHYDIKAVDLDISKLSKGGFDHFMLKEISYIHAEGYPAAEMKHDPIALVDQDMPIVFLATHHQLYEKIISNMQEVKSRNGRILAVVTEGDQQVKEIADNVLEVPRTLNALVPLLSVVPLQLLAYYVAVDKGLDVDMPRNLAKSVTVE